MIRIDYFYKTLCPHSGPNVEARSRPEVQQKLGDESLGLWRLFGTENFVLLLINCCHIFNRFIVIRVCGAAHIAGRTINPVERIPCGLENASRYSGWALTLIYCRQHNSDDEIISDARCYRTKLCTDSDCESFHFRWSSSICAYLRGACFPSVMIVFSLTTLRVTQNVNRFFL